MCSGISVFLHSANNVGICLQLTLGQLLLITMVTSELRQAMYSNTGLCSTDAPATVKTSSRIRCSTECLHLASCRDFNHNSSNNECSLFRHKPLFFKSKQDCAGFKARQFVILLVEIRSNVKEICAIRFLISLRNCNIRSVQCRFISKWFVRPLQSLLKDYYIGKLFNHYVSESF